MNPHLTFLTIALLSCQNQPAGIKATLSKLHSDSMAQVRMLETSPDTLQPVKRFLDSTHIGQKNSNKIDLQKFETSDSSYVVLRWYSKRHGQEWKLRQEVQFEQHAFHWDPQIADFNNDGYNDLTYIPDIAARGANEIRKLFMYDPGTDKLIYLKNSEDYPNIRYNSELNCIDAFFVYGGCSTVFLRINGDQLTEFASVQNEEGFRTIYQINKAGQSVLLRRDSIEDQGYFTRYKNYNPITPNNE